MGTIDSTTHTLGCAACGIEESATVLDKGNMYSGSSWQAGASFAKFETTWTGSGKTEPTLLTATCKRCGASAERR
jgi:ribosomal protein L37E